MWWRLPWPSPSAPAARSTAASLAWPTGWSPQADARGLRDFLGLLREHGIGFGLWTYKAMDFGLVDLHGQVVDPEYLAIVRGEVTGA